VEIEVAGVEVVAGPRGVRLRGPAEAIVAAVQGLRGLKDAPEGSTAQLGTWTLVVSEYIPETLSPHTVSMPGHAWNIAASVLSDAALGEYENPFDFGDVGYLNPRPDPDIGVEVTDAD
jgi:hypothetical protein